MNNANISYTSKSPYNTTDNSPSMYSTTTLFTNLDDLRHMNYPGIGKEKGKGKSNKGKHDKNNTYQNMNGNDANADVSTKENEQSVCICTDNKVCDKCLNKYGYLY